MRRAELEAASSRAGRTTPLGGPVVVGPSTPAPGPEWPAARSTADRVRESSPCATLADGSLRAVASHVRTRLADPVRKFGAEVRARARLLEANAADGVAIQALAALPGQFLPWTSFSMRPAAILGILNDVEMYQREAVVECGSGNSTIFVARLLALRGTGQVTTIEHDPQWATLTERLLNREGLERWARVVRAPLVDGWYDTACLPDLPKVDLLVVDGPPAWARSLRGARAPALDRFAQYLTKNATVILDDAWRRGERQVLKRWTATHGRQFRRERGGFAISAPHIV